MTRRRAERTKSGSTVTGVETAAQRWDALLAHRESMVRLARLRGAGADAEDVANEALLRAYTRPDLDLDRARSYLAKVATNLVIDLRRRDAREHWLRAHAGVVLPVGTTDEEVEERELGRHAGRLIAELDPYLHTILMRRGAGVSWQQIANELGQPKATVEMRYRRGIARLRRQLSP